MCGSAHDLWPFWEGELVEDRRNLVGESDLDIHVGAVTQRCGKCRGSREGVGLASPHFQPYKGL